MSRILVVRTGAANLASVEAALKRAGCDPLISQDAAEIASAELLVLPGVGSFGAVMQVLEANGLTDVLRARIARGRPTLAICLGLQVMFASSEESPGARGLGVFEQPVERFRISDQLPLPQMGWNRVAAPDEAKVLASGDVYYANSYRVAATKRSLPGGWLAALSTHGEEFIAAVEGFDGRVVACQFHPELSGAFGRSLIERWVAVCTAGSESPKEARAC